MKPYLLTLLRLCLLVSLFCGITGCVDDGSPAPDRSGLLLPPEEGDYLHADGREESPDEAAAKLAGACPYGLSCCGAAGCGLFTDLNKDGCCDLGVVE